MPKFHIRPAAVTGDRVVFDEQEARHLVRVLRLGRGDLVQATDGQGSEFTVRLEEVARRLVTGRILARCDGVTESPVAITLAQGIPKGEKMDWIVKTATELGAVRVIPLLTTRCLGRLTLSGWRERSRRWQRIAKEAAKQCGRAVVPQVEAHRALTEFVTDGISSDLAICLWEEERQGLSTILDSVSARPTSALLIVGPEGGLAVQEVDLLRGSGVKTAGLGPRVLRTETAGPVGVALLQARFGDL